MTTENNAWNTEQAVTVHNGRAALVLPLVLMLADIALLVYCIAAESRGTSHPLLIALSVLMIPVLCGESEVHPVVNTARSIPGPEP
ncbi:MAG: hypothetical protein QM330_02130 [Acidobacteriota bacterium]|jgi:hypothetical protein|nr:hypothetical protein [Acidobacteriota bacterium]NLT33992.1 hypothetical protein [Acidobacteriota bacterium]